MMRSLDVILAGFLMSACGSRDSDSDRVAVRESVSVAAPAPKPPAQCLPHEHVCRGDEVVECSADGVLGATLQTCKVGCKAGTCSDACATQGVELIYVVDTDNHLSSFDPQKLPADPFRLVGTLTCDPAHHPFSMAVDRTGIAWVLYSDGTLYRVSILDGHCTRVGVATGTDVPALYGMGFATDGSKSTTETLYVAASSEQQRLGRLDITASPPRWTTVGPIAATQPASPELTGTADGALFAYFPETKPGFVQQIDPKSGAFRGKRHPLTLDGRIEGWAMAHSAGLIYEFVTVDDNSQIHSIRRKTGEHQLVREHLPNRIVGAGVSTCAPELERAIP